MDIVQGFEIKFLEKEGWYVVEGNGFYQNIDFINGGLINTLDKAVSIREALIADLKKDPVPVFKTNDERLDKLELINKEIDGRILNIQMAITELAEITLGGL